MKKNKKLGYKTWLKHNCQDVTAKYKKDIVPNYGKVTFQNGYISDTSTKQDAKYAEFIQQKIGGNVTLRCGGGPDYEWLFKSVKKQWEKKSPKKLSSLSNRVKKAYEQLSKSQNVGGMFFDLDNIQNAMLEKVVKIILSELYYRNDKLHKTTFDVIITKGNEVIVAYTIKND